MTPDEAAAREIVETWTQPCEAHPRMSRECLVDLVATALAAQRATGAAAVWREAEEIVKTAWAIETTADVAAIFRRRAVAAIRAQPVAPPEETPLKFRKLPIIVDALQWTGTNRDEVLRFTLGRASVSQRILIIDTLEGAMRAELGDWIICGVKGEFYPCKPDIFRQSYEPVAPPEEPR